MDTKISLPFVLSLAALALVVLCCLIAIVFAMVALDDDDPADRNLVVGSALVVALVWAVVTAFCLWPFDMQYHQWQKTTGVVDVAHSRFLAGDNGPSEEFVVVFTDGRTRRCDDSRCAVLRPGDRLTLWCKREWQWASEPGWGCRWGGRHL